MFTKRTDVSAQVLRSIRTYTKIQALDERPAVYYVKRLTSVFIESLLYYYDRGKAMLCLCFVLVDCLEFYEIEEICLSKALETHIFSALGFVCVAYSQLRYKENSDEIHISPLSARIRRLF